MSGPQFTPGPWQVFAEGKVVEVLGPEANRLPIVKWTGFDGCDRPLKVQVANARLIAAAPRLYAALEGLQLQALQSSCNDPANEWGRDALAEARGALAEARGQQ